MRELVDRLISDPDMLPCEAAESISISRITSREKDRKASDIMESIITILGYKYYTGSSKVISRDRLSYTGSD